MGSFLIGYKGKEFIQENIYLPVRSALISYPDISQYKQTKCPKNSLIIATFGQANSTNGMTEKSDVEIPPNLYQYDWKSQKCYFYKEPLLGTSGIKGNVITYTATQLAKKSRKPIVIIPFGVGNTSVLEWAYGDLSFQHSIIMKRLKKSTLSPRIFLWHQGETDSKTSSVSFDTIIEAPYFQNYFQQKGKYKGMIPLTEEVYYNALRKIAESTLNNFPESSFGIALATRCGNKIWNPVRSAQKRISEELPNSFISADSDKITGLDKRPDNCHFSAKGASELGNLYYESITREIN